jgi:hypothetical protein
VLIYVHIIMYISLRQVPANGGVKLCWRIFRATFNSCKNRTPLLHGTFENSSRLNKKEEIFLGNYVRGHARKLDGGACS